MSCFGLPNQVESNPIAAQAAEVEQLRDEVRQLREERARLEEIQRRIMDLLGVAKPDHLVHDIRNLLHERELLRTLCEGKF